MVTVGGEGDAGGAPTGDALPTSADPSPPTAADEGPLDTGTSDTTMPSASSDTGASVAPRAPSLPPPRLTPASGDGPGVAALGDGVNRALADAASLPREGVDEVDGLLPLPSSEAGLTGGHAFADGDDDDDGMAGVDDGGGGGVDGDGVKRADTDGASACGDRAASWPLSGFTGGHALADGGAGDVVTMVAVGGNTADACSASAAASAPAALLPVADDVRSTGVTASRGGGHALADGGAGDVVTIVAVGGNTADACPVPVFVGDLPKRDSAATVIMPTLTAATLLALLAPPGLPSPSDVARDGMSCSRDADGRRGGTADVHPCTLVCLYTASFLGTGLPSAPTAAASSAGEDGDGDAATVWGVVACRYFADTGRGLDGGGDVAMVVAALVVGVVAAVPSTADASAGVDVAGDEAGGGDGSGGFTGVGVAGVAAVESLPLLGRESSACGDDTAASVAVVAATGASTVVTTASSTAAATSSGDVDGTPAAEPVVLPCSTAVTVVVVVVVVDGDTGSLLCCCVTGLTAAVVGPAASSGSGFSTADSVRGTASAVAALPSATDRGGS